MYTVVVTRFTEPWHKVWTIYNAFAARLDGTQWRMIVYNRRQEDADSWEWEPCDKPDNVDVQHMQNVGREAYVVLNHIYEHYDDLIEMETDVTAFIPANWDSHFLRTNAINSILTMKKHFLPYPEHVPWSTEKDFVLDAWSGANCAGGNYEEVIKQPYTPAKLRPYGRWYKERIPVQYTDLAVITGTFSAINENVLRYKKEQYKSWMDEIAADGVNSELAHFWERTWYSLFS